MTIRKDKGLHPMIRALEEPAFMFNAQGRFQNCNKAGREILNIMAYPPGKRPEDYDAFVHILKFSGHDDGTSFITIGEKRYRLVTGMFEDGVLVRLLPSYESSHILRLSYSLDILPWALVTFDRSQDVPVVVYRNERLKEFLQNFPDIKTGQAVVDIFQDAGITDDMNDILHTSGVCHYDYEARRGGRICWYRLHFIPYAPQSPYCLMVIEDTTESKIMEGQYFQAQRLEALGQLAGGVAHDFNNILSIIDGYARMARKNLGDNPDVMNFMERISQAVQRGSSLTNQLLTFGRHKVMNETVFDLGVLVRDQEPLLRSLMDASIAFKINCEENVFVDVTADHICQILMNICINARDAMPDGGDLSINVQKTENGCVLLECSDTGCGMPPEVRAKIFDPFFTTKDQGKGTGLGLSMVYGLVKGMNSDIDVISHEGKGTVFRIYLPQPVREKETPVDVQDGVSLQLHGVTALIAEDEPDLLNLVSGMMEEMGATVIRASNGREALALQDKFEGDIDILLTDVVMPELSGVKLAEMFGVLRPSSRIMFMSGYPANGKMARVELPEGCLLMAKPVDFNKLSMALKTVTPGRNDTMKTQWKMNSLQWKNV